MFDIVPATPELMERFYRGRQKRSARALVALRDGEPVAVVGVYLDRTRWVLFSDRTVDPVAHKRDVVRLMRAAKELLNSSLPVYACAELTDAARRTLVHMGFVQVKGDVYQWLP